MFVCKIKFSIIEIIIQSIKSDNNILLYILYFFCSAELLINLFLRRRNKSYKNRTPNKRLRIQNAIFVLFK